jgi:PPOX class probable F420-dependent enzyme
VASLGTEVCRARFADADHAHLATVGADGVPHLVPVVHALTTDVDGAGGALDTIVVVVDHKPKRTTDLRRLRNIRDEPRVCFLVDAYSSDWDALWWVRADARAEVVEGGPRHAAAVALLQRRFAQYRVQVPTGPAVVARVERWTGWAARG